MKKYLIAVLFCAMLWHPTVGNAETLAQFMKALFQEMETDIVNRNFEPKAAKEYVSILKKKLNFSELKRQAGPCFNKAQTKEQKEACIEPYMKTFFLENKDMTKKFFDKEREKQMEQLKKVQALVDELNRREREGNNR